MRQSGQVTSGVSSSFDEGLGALVHGPCVLSTGPGIGIGLRCAFAYLDGLLLSVEVKAIGQAAQDATSPASAWEAAAATGTLPGCRVAHRV